MNVDQIVRVIRHQTSLTRVRAWLEREMSIMGRTPDKGIIERLAREFDDSDREMESILEPRATPAVAK